MVDNGGANNKAKPNHKIKLSSRLIIRNLSSFKNGSYVVKYKLMHDPEPREVIRIIRFSWSLINNHWHYLFTLMWSSTLVRRNKNTPKNIQSTITITTTMNTATIYWYHKNGRRFLNSFLRRPSHNLLVIIFVLVVIVYVKFLLGI